MKPKIIISLICILVLMFQLLPVKQLGSMLFSNQIQEELPHAADDIGKDVKGKPEFKKDFHNTHDFTPLNYIHTTINNYIHFATVLPLSHIGEIHTPPPNAS